MNIIMKSVIKTLENVEVVLTNLTNENYSNASVGPYYTSVGSHIRHILDYYMCILSKNEAGMVDLTARRRQVAVEENCPIALDYYETIKELLVSSRLPLNEPVVVIDDLGLGKIELDYTYAALLSQANSHTVHHFAIINYILTQLNIQITDANFGYNPSTPKYIKAE
ncbi:hypothetical protein Q4566_02795 [Tamlana sp. 2_MG-2023]|uniref:hypothetical protein n=1 Tax=unclassified Tamlana TaxID=2614803 RepID=UPI0026E474F9|nr:MULTISPECIES: hypothetical protein [unclassified Tamlana]MDO6759116.1 hypothetical protein [Tamlana sp. 2_MG-2023]MDO6789815.1 hypothetical protein [Tamlana sp. 1_MG-2023]